MKRFRMDVNPDHLVTRHFRIDDPDHARLREAMAAIDRMPGVQDVTWHADSASLNVLYDAGVERVDAVLAAITASGLSVQEDWHSRLSEALWRFEDDLLRASLEDSERHLPS